MGTHTIFLFEISTVESLSLGCLHFTKVSLCPQVSFHGNEESSTPPPCGFLIGIGSKKLFVILFSVLSGLAQFSPGSVYVDGHLNLFACGFAHQG